MWFCEVVDDGQNAMAIISLWLSRRQALKDGIHILCASAALILLWNPLLIEDVSFQLSFLVTGGLILFVPQLAEIMPNRWPSKLKALLAVTVVAQIVSFPLTLFYFHSFHFLSGVANFFLVPFIGMIVIPLGMIALILGTIWVPLGFFPAQLVSFCNAIIFRIVEGLSHFVSFHLIWPQPSLSWVFFSYFIIFLGFSALKKSKIYREEKIWLQKNRQKGNPSANDRADSFFPPNKQGFLWHNIFLILLVLIWFIWGSQPRWIDRAARVSFLNVGQGDAILLRTGKGKHLLVDTGGAAMRMRKEQRWKKRRDPYEVGRKLLVPLLMQRGVNQLDALIITHLHLDHYGGAFAILDAIPVKRVIYNGSIDDTPEGIKLLKKIKEKRIPLFGAAEGKRWTLDQTTKIRFLFPHRSSNEIKFVASKEQNNESVTMIVTFYGQKFMLSGDLESSGETAVVEREHNKKDVDRGDIKVLKAGHHGSKTSSTALWLSYWRPFETVISAGENNSFGHPHPEVVARLHARQRPVWQTNVHGEIQYRISPNGQILHRNLYEGSDK